MAKHLILSLLLVLVLIRSTSGLYFFLERGEQKCFIEEVPKETTVVGLYKSEEYLEAQQKFNVNPTLGIQIVVEELPSKKVIVNQKGPHLGRFTFTTSEAGDHAICINTNSSGGWFNIPRAKVFLDLMFGEPPSDNKEAKKEIVSDLTERIRSLVAKVAAIRREHKYQREREELWRDTSERANSRVVNWTIIQMVVLGLTCWWQVRHLRKFFISKKLV